MASVYEREFVFSRKDFEYVRDLVGDHTGIVLSDHKMDMVYGRLARRLRTLGLETFDEYLGLLDCGDDTELIEFTNALTTNLTSFFREPHHFEYLTNTAIPTLIEGGKRHHRLRVWSAGCSTGEEPYTLSIAINEALSNIKSWDVRILATDLDTNVVEKGKAGIYDIERVNGIERSRLRRWFKQGAGDLAGSIRVSKDLKSLITFKQLNLLHQWPMKGSFDVIFCRNVVIYFSKDTQRELFDRYADLLADDGYLFVGHSESLHNVSERFHLIGKTIYRKIK